MNPPVRIRVAHHADDGHIIDIRIFEVEYTKDHKFAMSAQTHMSHFIDGLTLCGGTVTLTCAQEEPQ